MKKFSNMTDATKATIEAMIQNMMDEGTGLSREFYQGVLVGMVTLADELEMFETRWDKYDVEEEILNDLELY